MKIIDERERQKQRQKGTGVMQAIVKVWELNNFVAPLSLVFSN